jgi:dTDP-glucose 4,6-dehydratase/UDP-glucose 4-epimerase
LKILILGSQGFIGSHLTNFFCVRNHIVYGCDIVNFTTSDFYYSKTSILDPDFEIFISTHQFDVCINASGNGNVSFSFEDPILDFNANIVAVNTVLFLLSKYQPTCKFIHFSSAAVYGNPVLLPVSEESALQPQSPYGYHKLLSENICKKYFHLYNIPILILRPFSVYGNRLKKQIVWDVCHKMKNHDTIEMFGTGNESRDFIHIDDLLNCIDLLIKNANFCADIINIGNGDEVKIKDLVTLIRNHYPNKEVVFTNTTRIGDPLNWKADIAKLKKIGYKRSVSLVDGISQYINWFNDEILIDA